MLQSLAWLDLAVGKHVHKRLHGQVADSNVLHFASFLARNGALACLHTTASGCSFQDLTTSGSAANLRRSEQGGSRPIHLFTAHICLPAAGLITFSGASCAAVLHAVHDYEHSSRPSTVGALVADEEPAGSA